MLKSLLLAVSIIAHEPGYYTSLANHIQRWLKEEKIESRVITPAGMGAALQKEKLAFLVGFSSPTSAEIASLKAFRARGGKLVVFYSGSPELASLMGVKVLGYKAADYPGQWSTMNFNSKVPDGLPLSILQTSTVLMRAAPLEGRGRVMAIWSDRKGKSTGDAAWIATTAGYWMTHVLLADGEEDQKARLCAAIVGSIEPGKWSFSSFLARKTAKDKAMRAFAASQTPAKGEIHAVWDHSGCGLYPGNWAKTIRVLKEAHVTDLFVNVCGAGFAHYPSSVLPRSKIYEQEGDQLAACLAVAKGSGIRVHAWMLAFNATRASPDRLEVFRKRGWRLKLANGKLTEYLDPANSEVRKYVLDAVTEVQAKYAIAGVHLDFVRYGDGTLKPKNAADQVTSFVSEARRTVKRPRWLTTAVYGKYPNCIGSVGQDWSGWLRLGLVDYVVPMDYTESNSMFEEFLQQHAAAKLHARKTIAGIGVTANESRLDARKVIEQINLTRRYGLAGNALFDLDTTLERKIFPYLKMGSW